MCRWLAYSGVPVLLEELVIRPQYSLISQSLAARSAARTTNADGFGMGWYGTQEVPGLYRSLRPAWNDQNLRDLARQIQSSLFLAHVRAATGSAVQQANCHPFRFGKWLLVHNGYINQFERVKRDLAFAVAPELYPKIEGTTDSELMLFLALTFGMQNDPLRAIERMVGFVEGKAEEFAIEKAVRMTLGITDGERIIAVRYSSEKRSPSLFYSKSMRALWDLNPELRRFSDSARAVVSEPLTDLTDCWEEIPESTVVILEQGEVTTQSFQPRAGGE